MNDVILIPSQGKQPFEVVFYQDSQGRIPVADFLASLDKKTVAKVKRNLSLLEQYGPYLKRPFADKVRGPICELRIRQTRILYAFDQKIIVLLQGFLKKTNRIPENEIAKAERRLTDWVYRRQKGMIVP